MNKKETLRNKKVRRYLENLTREGLIQVAGILILHPNNKDIIETCIEEWHNATTFN